MILFVIGVHWTVRSQHFSKQNDTHKNNFHFHSLNKGCGLLEQLRKNTLKCLWCMHR